MRTVHTDENDEDERAWATRLARAFLAPPEPALVAPDEEPRRALMVAVAVVPVPVLAHDEAGGDAALRWSGDEEGDGDG